MNNEKWSLNTLSLIPNLKKYYWKKYFTGLHPEKGIVLTCTLNKYCTNLHPDQGAILILLRPEMKSTFHHTLIALAIVDILFLLTLIVDSQVWTFPFEHMVDLHCSKIRL